MLGRFERGEIGPDEWRGYRLVRGTYGQRQNADAQMLRIKIPQGILHVGRLGAVAAAGPRENADPQMLRIKIPQGILDVAQLDAVADAAERYSRGFGHITTRQNIQLHFLKLHDVELAMRRVADAGLTTREACGNSVRNITAC